MTWVPRCRLGSGLSSGEVPIDRAKKLLPTVTEKAFRQQVVDLAKLLGWSVYFTWQSKHSPAGFPDLVFCRASRIIFVELKSEAGKLTTAQKLWLADLAIVEQAWPNCVGVYVWYPHDWMQIERC